MEKRNLDELLEFNESNKIFRHKTTMGNLNSILMSGVSIKPHEDIRFTFEGIDSFDATNSTGYLDASEKGEGETVTTYFQIPFDLLNNYGANFDDLRMTYYDYMNFITNYVFELNNDERNSFSQAETCLFLFRDELELSFKNNYRFRNKSQRISDENPSEIYLMYKKSKEQLSGNALRSIIALESFITGCQYNSGTATIIPSIFIKCYGDDNNGYQLNEEFYENLPNRERVIQGIIDHLKNNKGKTEIKGSMDEKPISR